MPHRPADPAPPPRPATAIAGFAPDVMIGGTMLAAIILLVGTGSSWFSSYFGLTIVDGYGRQILAATLLLNIAIILFGWRRFRELDAELRHRRAAEARAHALACYDPLTGLYNRRAFAIETTAAMAGWAAAGRATAALVIDIDSFKSINDLFGHAGGDTVLQATATRLRGLAPAEALLARLGGDEFAMIFPADGEAETALSALGEELARCLADPVVIDGVSASTSASIGGALAGAPQGEAAADGDALLRHADAAMYRAKRLGRCRYCRFDDVLENELARRDVIERELKIAIDRDQLYPVYEPLIDLASGRPVGYEMLARWVSPTLGEVGPSEFIPVAEEKGLISLLADHLFRKALGEARSWPAELSLSLNVSPLQLRDPWFAQKLLRLLAESGFPGGRLVVEITESAIIDNLPLAQAVFASLRNQGIRMALDDFGTGYSSIASLRALPFDSVKIDREYVQAMAGLAEGESVAEAVLQLGRSLGLPVVAEGIENGDTAQRLGDLDCAIGQGYLYGHSLSSAEVIARHSGMGEQRAVG